MRVISCAYVVAATVLLGGCAAAHQPFRGSGEWKAQRGTIESVVVLPPLISSGHFDESGALAFRDASAASAATNVQHLLQRMLRKKLGNASVSMLAPEDASEVEAARREYERINRYIINYSYAPGAGSLPDERVSIGPAFRDSRIEADAAIFLWAEDFTIDRSYLAEVAKGIGRAALSGSGVEPVRGGSASTAYPRGISIGVVRVSNGEIIWFNYSAYYETLQLDKRRECARILDDLMRWM